METWGPGEVEREGEGEEKESVKLVNHIATRKMKHEGRW